MFPGSKVAILVLVLEGVSTVPGGLVLSDVQALIKAGYLEPASTLPEMTIFGPPRG